MLEIRATCRGISPLLMNPMTDGVLEGLRTGIHSETPRDLTVEQTAAMRIYKDPADEETIGVPAVNLYRAIMEAGRDKNLKKIGGAQISTATSSQVPSFMWLDQEFLVFKDQGDKERRIWVPDKRRGRLPKDKTAVCIVRPKFSEWEFDVKMSLDEKTCDVSTARRLLEIAGNKIGLCDFRPTRNGSFGRFRVACWESRKLD